MTTLTKGNFTVNLGFVRIGGDFSDEDRQCAWELYTEISTRVAIIGKSNDSKCKDFSGELYIESLASFYNFFQESRKIMRKFPVGHLPESTGNHLGILISNMISDVMRPFLETWQVNYRHWWENKSNPRLSPLDRQKEFPDVESFLEDWSNVRLLFREVKKELSRTYKLIEI